jgi:hypothetical protein
LNAIGSISDRVIERVAFARPCDGMVFQKRVADDSISGDGARRRPRRSIPKRRQ